MIVFVMVVVGCGEIVVLVGADNLSVVIGVCIRGAMAPSPAKFAFGPESPMPRSIDMGASIGATRLVSPDRADLSPSPAARIVPLCRHRQRLQAEVRML
jgi:hypothetical protein